MLNPYTMDLHIHTCLSPCGSSKNVPTTIVTKAIEQGLHAIAICDHNSGENVPAVRKAAGDDLTVFGGMEITTMEEIHLLAIFPSDDQLFRMQELVYEHLPGENNPEYFGPQYIVDEEDYVVGTNPHLLIGASTLSLERMIDEIHQRSGLAIAAHIDREAFSLISQLGFIPPDIELDAVELSPYYKKNQMEPATLSYPYTFFSDAHQPEDIGKKSTVFYIAKPLIRELQKALKGLEGRRVLI